MVGKRHLVLYGVAALVLLVLAGVIVFGGGREVSDTAQETVATSTGTTMATSTGVTEYSAASAPASKPFLYEIASTDAARIQGLSGRANIQSDYGMLFVFPAKERHGFWMKDMKEAIDIIWISDERTVLGVEANVSPATYPNVFYPPEPVRYVLETKAGEAVRLGLTPGTRLNLPLSSLPRPR